MNLNQITLPAVDLERSVAFYRAMGFTQIVDAPHYARFECTEGEATFSVHRVEDAHPSSGLVVYFECSKLAHRVACLQATGFVFSSLPTDEPWLWREARLRDPAGNELCLFWAGDKCKNPPWRMNSTSR